MRKALIAILSCLLAVPALAADYRDSPVPGWREVVFHGRTDYRQTGDGVCAHSHAAASGLIREVDADLTATPELTWSWRAEKPLKPGNRASERSRDGDDYVARVYVIRRGFFFWQTRAINYVWARHQPVGAHWPNPFTDHAMMVVVQSGDDGLGRWHSFRRNVRADFRRYFGDDVDRVDAVALMTDTDNTGGTAAACYRLPRLQAGNGQGRTDRRP